MSDLQHALDLQRQYDGLIPVLTVADVNYSIVDAKADGGFEYLLRGTTDLEDAKRDLEALMIPTPFGRVHKGAFDGMLALYHTELEPLPRTDLLRFKGHSLGAMEAAILACIAKGAGFTDIEVVTFESPRWGDAQAMEYFKTLNSRSYQNYKDMWVHDIFTMIPAHFPTEPYEVVPNCTRFWQEPTAANEWAGAPINIQAHSLSDCVIPALKILGV